MSQWKTLSRRESPYLHEEHEEQKSPNVSPTPHTVLAARRRFKHLVPRQIALRSPQQLPPGQTEHNQLCLASRV
ncbi:hypothetical protein Taro_041428 [Colocasia esculenta]|uniref:Uncharacterized protein n=1 Tax=Colocasia esculenta TaxID=4460 RepID=A0A843WVV7_COLES|nr:hypothetical protein [Colocasia esculenta]